jgi:hypothetical protein
MKKSIKHLSHLFIIFVYFYSLFFCVKKSVKERKICCSLVFYFSSPFFDQSFSFKLHFHLHDHGGVFLDATAWSKLVDGTRGDKGTRPSEKQEKHIFASDI